VLRPETPSNRIRALTRRNRTLVGILVVAIVIVGAGLATIGFAWTRRDAAYQRERAELRGRMDSLLQEGRGAVLALEGEVEGLADALARSNEELGRLRSGLDSAERADADEGELDDLRRRLQAATVALTRQQLAASLDFPSIEAANRNAVAVVYVELGPGAVSTATAFAVRPDGLLLTNRHVVRPEAGRPQPTRIGIQFAGSPQVWPGRVVTVSSEADLALLRVDNVLGEVPTILGLNEAADTLVAGTPVALLGFPLGGEPPSDIGRPAQGRPLPRPLVTAGVLEGRSDGLLEILGYGEEGASGSPVLDGSGRLIGVLFGGRGDGSRRTLLAVPVEEVARLLARAPRQTEVGEP
jgi:S1-C subfamily serine protease